MPKPVYIICSQSGTVDQATNLVSLFHVVESLYVRPETPEYPTPSLTFRTTAVWMRAERDGPDDEYESEFLLHLPGQQPESPPGFTGRFRFTQYFHRLVLDLTLVRSPDAGGIRFSTPGILRVECRIRPIGGKDWLSQEYPIVLNLAPSANECSATQEMQTG